MKESEELRPEIEEAMKHLIGEGYCKSNVPIIKSNSSIIKSSSTYYSLREEVGLGQSHPGYEWDDTRSTKFWDWVVERQR